MCCESWRPGRRSLAEIGWHGFVRFERDLLDPDFVSGLAAGGCRMLQLGLESGSQQVLDRLQKGTRLDEVARMLDNLRQAGIATYVYIMLGTPGETREDAELTLQFLERHAGAIDYLNLAIMNLPRESQLLDDPVSDRHRRFGSARRRCSPGIVSVFCAVLRLGARRGPPVSAAAPARLAGDPRYRQPHTAVLHLQPCLSLFPLTVFVVWFGRIQHRKYKPLATEAQRHRVFLNRLSREKKSYPFHLSGEF